MTLKAELAHIVESQRLTAFLQSLIATHRNQDSRDADFQRHDHCLGQSSYIGSTAFKESAFVFTDSGAYADMATVLLLVNEVAMQSSPSNNSIKIDSL